MANNLTLTSASFDTTGQKFGSAALSGGFGIAPGGLIASLPLAFEIEFKRSTAPGSLEVIIGQSGLGWIGMTTAGHVQFEFGTNPPVDFTSAASAADGAWHHAAISATASGFSCYLDGVLVGTSGSAPAGLMFQASGTAPGAVGYLGVGNHGGSQQFQFGGEVDEAAVWSGNRYPAAFARPTAPYAGSEAGLVALWHLDGNGVDSTAGPTISAPLVAGLMAGGTTTVSGTFAAGAPTGLSQVLDGVTANVGSPTITTTTGSGAAAAGTWSYVLTTPGAGAHSIQVNGTGPYSSTGAATNFTTSAAQTTTILPANAAIAYSPYTWAAGKTINPGAYLRLAFTGGSITFNFDLSAQSAPLPQLWISIDGAPPQQFTLASTISPSMPATTTGWPKHFVEVVVKSTSNFVSRWSPQAAAVVLTGITLAGGATVSAPAVLPHNVLMYGDSITEGYHTVATGDTDGSDAALGWAYALRRLLGAEVGIVGFGGTGLLSNGQGAVPPIGQSYTQLWSGAARSFSPSPSLVIINEGENDKTAVAATFQAAFQAFLTALLTSVPGCPVAVLRPFSGAQAAAIQMAIELVGSPRLHYVDTTGLFDTTLSTDGQHPLGVANLAGIGPGVAGLVAPLLTGIVNRWSHA